MIILDSHCDTPSQTVRLRDLSKRTRLGHVDFLKLREGGVDACFFALYTPQSKPLQEASAYVDKMISVTTAQIESYPLAALAGTVEEIRSNKDKGLTSILFGLENGMPIGQDLSALDALYKRGVRYVTLTHNGDNQIADSASQGTTWGGLSPFGREVVARMNSLGMIVDLAHASDKTFFDCIEASRTPIVSTHSCCRALASHRRNMTDDMLRALADKGGVIQINFYPCFLSDEFSALWSANPLSDQADAIEEAFIADPADKARKKAWDDIRERILQVERPSYTLVCDHIDHAVNKAGIESVGIGSDFDGITVAPKGMEDISKIGLIFDELHRRRYSDDAIEKIAGANFLRVFADVESASA